MRAGRAQRKLERKPRRRGGKAKKRGLSREQVPILVAADRGGETLSHTLPALNTDSVKEVLEPVLAPDALLVSDANRCYPPAAAALDIPHESINASAGERVRGAVHIQTVNSRHSQIKRFLRGFRGIATKYLDSYLEMVPSHRTRRPAIAKSLPRGGNDKAMPTIHELSFPGRPPSGSGDRGIARDSHRVQTGSTWGFRITNCHPPANPPSIVTAPRQRRPGSVGRAEPPVGAPPTEPNSE